MQLDPGKKITRPPIMFTRPQQRTNAQQPPCQKTKSAICFLCLFDGLRTPSIRRLVRKPRTVCKMPLLTFDPSFYAPSSQNAIHDLYQNSVKCSCDIAVDPSVQTVLTLLRKHGTSMPVQRVLVHYFGHGCYPPTDEGSLFFFSDDRSRYKPLKVANLINACPAPLCVIIDAPSASSLYKHFATKPDVFAFFSCAAGEQLPLSTDAPLDLFSSCLLNPYDTAVWWHLRHYSRVLKRIGNAAETNKDFMIRFLDAVLESIAFDIQAPGAFERFSADPSVFALARGFVLAQRILLSFNIHSQSLPELRPMANHSLWGFWDTVLDCALTMNASDSSEMIFNLFMTSFDAFPSTGCFPIFSFYLRSPEFHGDAVRRLLKFIDETDSAAAAAARSNVPKTIVELDKPSAASLVILAKTIATEHTSPFEPQTPLSFASSKDSGVLRAGMCALCCAIGTSAVASFNRLTQVCIDHSADCAPYSALLLGLLMERAGRLMNTPPFASRFLPLLQSKKTPVRASTAFLLGLSKDPDVCAPLVPLLHDPAPIVRQQAFAALATLMKAAMDPAVMQELHGVLRDEDAGVRETAEAYAAALGGLEAGEVVQWPQNSALLSLLIASVKAHGFIERFEDDAFMRGQ